MSSDDQHASIAQQRREVRALAKRLGYKIIHEYIDYGKSGAKYQHKRTGLQQLLSDSDSGAFKFILLWDLARLSRLDSIDGAAIRSKLRSNGISLVTCKGQIIDWKSLPNKLLDFLETEKNNEYLLNLSQDSLRGRVDCTLEGSWPCGTFPFGYDRLCIFAGKETIIPRTDPFRKPKNAVLKLVVNEKEAKTVILIFALFVEKRKSLRQIARTLDKLKVPTRVPGGSRWTKDAIKAILRNRAYVGIIHFGFAARKAKELFNVAPPTQLANACPSIVTRNIFDRAQRKLDQLKTRGNHHQEHRSGSLSGIVFCQHCGFPLEKKTRRNLIYYSCGSPVYRPELDCHQWRVHENSLMRLILRVIHETVDEKILEARRWKPSDQLVPDGKLLDKRRAQIHAKLETAIERQLTISEQFKATAEAVLNKLQKQLDEIDEEIDAVRSTGLDRGQEFIRRYQSISSDLIVLRGPQHSDGTCSLCDRSILPKRVIRAARAKYGSGVIRCRISWDEEGQIVFEKTDAPLYEISVDNRVMQWEIKLEELKSSMLMEPSVFRELADELGLKVTLKWKKVSKRNWLLNHVRIVMSFPRHFLAERSNRRTRAHSRDMD